MNNIKNTFFDLRSLVTKHFYYFDESIHVIVCFSCPLCACQTSAVHKFKSHRRRDVHCELVGFLETELRLIVFAQLNK